MFEQQPPLRPASSDAATDHGRGQDGGVAAVLARWTVEDPGPAAVAELATIDPTTLSEADRVRLVIALERQAGWLASLQLPALVAVGDAYTEVVAEARDRTTERLTAAAAAAADPAAAADDRGGRSVAQTVAGIFGDDPDRWASMELATALHVAEFTAGQRLHVARVLPTRLPHLDQALRAGRVSYGHVLLVVRATEPLSDQAAREVDAKLAPRYGTATPGGLRNSAGHAVIAADPDGAQQRQEEAARRRKVSSRPEQDGMATLALFHTAADISLLEAAICDIAEATAQAARHAGRLIPDHDALRADALIGLARYWLTDTWPIPEPDPRDQPDGARGRTPAPQSRGGDSSGDRQSFPDNTWHHSRPAPDDPDGDATDQRPPDQREPHDNEPDHHQPDDNQPDDNQPDDYQPDDYHPDDYLPDEDPDGGGTEGGRADPGGADPGGADPSGADPGGADQPRVRWGKRGLRRPGRDRTVVNIVIDLPTLLGLADNPARLDGYGSIPAALARRIAADGSWRRMITDPITRRLLDRSPNTYRPGAQLAAYVRARDLTCDHPGCTKPAEGCQLDHDDPFNLTDPDGGRTTAGELKLRCEPHHNGKTHLGWATGLRADGTRFTRSPLGFDYDLEPNPYLDHGARRTRSLRAAKND